MSTTHDTPIVEIPDEIYPSSDDLKNGWTPKKVRAYLMERRQQQIDYAGKKRPMSVVVRNSEVFDPFSW